MACLSTATIHWAMPGQEMVIMATHLWHPDADWRGPQDRWDGRRPIGITRRAVFSIPSTPSSDE